MSTRPDFGLVIVGDEILSGKRTDKHMPKVIELLGARGLQLAWDAQRGVPLNYQERRIWHFNQEIDRVIGAERIPAALRVPALLDSYVER